MKNNTKKILFFLYLGIIFAILILNNDRGSLYNKEILQDTERTESKISWFNNSQTPISIDGDNPANDWQWARTQKWCRKGDGSYAHPYVIENVTIDVGGSGSGITIKDSKNVYFIINNCTVYNTGSGAWDAGIKIENTNNGTLTNNNCSNNNEFGILVNNNCINNTISENIINNNLWGVFLYNNCDNNTISGNTVNNNDGAGILIRYNCDNNIVSENIANNNLWSGDFGGCGIYLEQNCEYNTIFNNTANDNRRRGITLEYRCNYNNITRNTLKGNTEHGIYIEDECINNTISGNTANNNIQHGIYLEDECVNNTISGNTANNNIQHGIYLDDLCGENTLSNNTVNDNGGYGIHLFTSCDINTITNNTIMRNQIGIQLTSSNYNTISENTLIDNLLCIFETKCTNNIIENNDCIGATKHVPIFIDDATTGIGARNWTWAVIQWGFSGSGTEGNPYIIKDLIIDGFGIASCIEIRNSDAHFIIKNCTVYDSGTGSYDAGIKLQNTNNGTVYNNTCSDNLHSGIILYTNCKNNNITENTIKSGLDGICLLTNCDENIIANNTANNLGVGILLYTSLNNTISGNTANNCNYGIKLESNCHYNTIMTNIVNDNKGHFLGSGIWLNNDCNNNNLTGNTANNNKDVGILLYGWCHNNTITNNSVNNNGLYGIFLVGDYTTIANNTANNNGLYGIYLAASDNNTITGNKHNINYNDVGGIFLENSDWNNITDNIINHNIIYGIHLSSSNYNNISNNEFIGNQICFFEDTCVGNEFSDNDCNRRPGLTHWFLDPKRGDQYTQFKFIVNYTDQDDDEPTYVNLVINGTVYAMDKLDILDTNFIDGCIYNFTITLAPALYNYTYYFECSDGYSTNTTNTFDDLKVNVEPVLTSGSVNPKKGHQNTQFTFTIIYTDQDNDEPAYINVVINGTICAMDKQDELDTNFIDGCIYQYTTTLTPSAYNYTYYFECGDGYSTNTTAIFDDLEVYKYSVPSDDDDDDDGAVPEESPLIPLIIVIGVFIVAGCIGVFIIWKRELFVKLKRK